jgi:hypothetical protein
MASQRGTDGSNPAPSSGESTANLEQGRSKNAPAPFAAVVIDKEEDIDWLLLDEDEQDALANLACVIGEEARHKSLVRKP